MFPSLLKDVTLLSVSVLLIAETRLTSTLLYKITLSKLACLTKPLCCLICVYMTWYILLHIGPSFFNHVQRASSLLQWLKRTLTDLFKPDILKNILPILAQLADDGARLSVCACKIRRF